MSGNVHARHEEHPKRKGLSTILKWAGAVAAIASLVITLSQVTDLFQGFSRRHREVTELVKAGKAEQDRKDYPAAFASYESAVKLDPGSRPAREGEAQSAMRWLENISADGHTFTEVADRLLPVLDQAATTAQGREAADLAAHVGWANFLKYREGSREGVTVEENYRRAISLDPQNVYAHAMWGHWIMWQGGKPEDADRHFSAALASGRERPYVRELQISAWLNREGEPEAEAALLRVANDMRKSGESMRNSYRRRLRGDIEVKFEERQELAQVLSALPPADMAATFEWLGPAAGDASDEAWKLEADAFVRANLSEMSGDRNQAVAAYGALRKELAGTHSILVAPVNEALKRLSAKP